MYKIILSGLILFLSLVLTSPVYGQETAKKAVLTMGRGTKNVIKEHKWTKPLIAYLASKLKDVGIEQGGVALPKDKKASTLIKFLKEGKPDVIVQSFFVSYQVKEYATPLLLAWRHGVRESNSLIFVRKDSGLKRLEDLKGKIIAFEDPRSTGGYIMPKLAIKAKGLDLIEVPSFNSSVSKGKIGYVFAREEINISSWVFYNKVAAGALCTTDWEIAEFLPESYKKHLEIIHKAIAVPRFMVMVRNGLDKKLVERIKEELLKMDKSEEGRKILKKAYGGISKFEELPGGPEGIFKPLEELLKASGWEFH